MPIMLSQTYDALVAAGAPEEKARSAAEEIAGYENRLNSIDNHLAVIDGRLIAIDGRLKDFAGRFTMPTWAIGINAAATIAILGVLLRH